MFECHLTEKPIIFNFVEYQTQYLIYNNIYKHIQYVQE